MTGVLAAVLFVVTLSGCAGAAASEATPPPPGPPDPAAQVTAMKKLSFMVGTWKGSGWYVAREGRVEFNQTEVVAPKLGGTLLVVDGDGRDAKDQERVVHSAFAVASYDTAASTYRWEAFANGSRLETTLTVGDAEWAWSFEAAPGVTVRYKAVFTADQWRETGEMSTDGGKTWIPNLDMTLQRTG